MKKFNTPPISDQILELLGNGKPIRKIDIVTALKHNYFSEAKKYINNALTTLVAKKEIHQPKEGFYKLGDAVIRNQLNLF